MKEATGVVFTTVSSGRSRASAAGKKLVSRAVSTPRRSPAAAPQRMRSNVTPTVPQKDGWAARSPRRAATAQGEGSSRGEPVRRASRSQTASQNSAAKQPRSSFFREYPPFRDSRLVYRGPVGAYFPAEAGI